MSFASTWTATAVVRPRMTSFASTWTATTGLFSLRTVGTVERPEDVTRG